MLIYSHLKNMYKKLLKKENKLAVIGLGYVGLPIALEFAKYISVIGFDINKQRIEMMNNKIDPSQELDAQSFDNCDIFFTHELEDLKAAQFFIIAVPTPVDEHKVPDLKPVLSASKTIGKVLKKGDYVVYESTVYPGCTEEDCLPILEELSGLKLGVDFKLGYSPERINPGDKEHTLTKITKVVSGNDDEALEVVAKVYELVVKAGVHKASSIKVAEAAKIIENTQRDLNIALMNELAIIFDKLNINTQEVLNAAKTKWNFLPFAPGLVGGHCIGVDPYYLTYKSISVGYKPDVILSGRRVNDEMSSYIAKRAVQMIIRAGIHLSQSKVLVMGVTFKEDVSDIRNSKVIDLIRELQSFSIQVDAIDAYASSDELYHEYGLRLVDKIALNYDCIVFAVKHKPYAIYDENYFKTLLSSKGILIDIKGVLNGKIKDLTYWSL